MSHDIANVNGKSSMAYAGEAPWHGLGQQLSPTASFEVWTKEAGLDFDVIRTPVQFVTPKGIAIHDSREVLYRDDTLDPLGIVSKGYQIVQPPEVIHFFADLAERAGFKLETAGALQKGQKVWALARVAEGFNAIGRDHVDPYVLMTTSFDGSTATSASFQAIRVVCQNTLRIALRNMANAVKVSHHSMWDAKAAKIELGLIDESWTEYQTQAKRMAEAPMSARQADAILVDVFRKAEQSIEEVRESTGYKTVFDLFYNEKSIGHELTEGRTVWAFTNAVTEYVDHIQGRLQDNRIRNAWYGAGSTMKQNAWQKAAELVK